MSLNDLLEKAARLQATQGPRDDKAATLDGEMTYAYALDITKSERDENGDLIVYGKATGPDRDLDGDRCEPAWLKRAMPKWFEWGNMREMHQPVLAGVGLEMTQDGDDWYVKSKVIDPDCAKKVETGGYKGQSIGIKNGVRQVRDGQSWIVDGEIVEISYVDRPCNPTAKLAIAKVAGDSWQPGEAEEKPEGEHSDDKAAAAEAEVEETEPAETEPEDTKAVEVEPEETKAAEAEEHAAPAPMTLDPREEMKALGFINKAAQAAASGEQADIDDANEAIAVISRLIISEANDLANGDLSEIRDIQLLMEAVCSLKWFIRSEESEQDGSDDMAYAYLAATADITKRSFSAEQRRKAAASGAAMPGGRYPIENAEDLHNAIHAIGRGKGSHEAIRQHIIRRAKALGLTSELPEDWMTKKTPEADETKSVEGTTETVEEIVKAAVAEVTKASEERIAALEAELTKVKSQPIPGGPVLLSGGATAPAKDDNATKAAALRAKAKAMDPAVAADYLAYADELDKQSA